jgi:hypothetical protein
LSIAVRRPNALHNEAMTVQPGRKVFFPSCLPAVHCTHWTRTPLPLDIPRVLYTQHMNCTRTNLSPLTRITCLQLLLLYNDLSFRLFSVASSAAQVVNLEYQMVTAQGVEVTGGSGSILRCDPSLAWKDWVKPQVSCQDRA